MLEDMISCLGILYIIISISNYNKLSIIMGDGSLSFVIITLTLELNLDY